MPLWHAINHGMTGLSTGGFSITDNSIATYDSALIDTAVVPIMVMGSIAFPVHFLMLRGDLRNLYTDLQTRWLFALFVLGSSLLTAMVFATGTYDSVARALRYGLFQFVSALSCTGFQTAVDATNVALGKWAAQAQLLVASGMFVGGAAGSTVGGIKMIRLATLLKGIQHRVAGVFLPESAVRRLNIDGRRLSEKEANREFGEAAIIATLWIAFITLSVFVLLSVLPSAAYSLQNVIFEVASAQSNVGLSAGITGPGMPDVGKVLFLFNMWIGRLEIIPVLVLLRAMFKRGGLYR
jgi:trk system potassium uptake protein TrkH